MTRQRRTFTPEFKLQLVKLYENGKPRAEIAREYDITPSALNRWIKNHKETAHSLPKTIVLRKKMNWRSYEKKTNV